MIAVLRAFLLFFALSLTLFLFVRVSERFSEGQEEGKSPVQGLKNEVTQARFFSRREDQRIAISFSKAVQQDERVTFQDIQAFVHWDEERSVMVGAEQGIYDHRTQRIDLQGDVRVTYGNGITLNTQTAFIHTRSGLIQGRKSTKGQTPVGHINASGFDIFNFGESLVFLGVVHALIGR